MELPDPVEQLCADFLVVAPDDLVTGLYLCGGLAFGEWIDGTSDVDFVATLSRRPGEADVEVLRNAHEVLRAKYPHLDFDGMHVLAPDLTRDPALLPPVPTVLAGEFDAEGHLSPEIAWAELATRGVTVAGPPVASLGVWHSAAALHAFTRHNLATYWRATADELAATPPEEVSEDACAWCVLGVARLDHLVVTGELTTKSGAGRWGIDHYPARFHPVLQEALRIREGGAGQYRADESRGQDVTEFVAYVVAGGGGGSAEAAYGVDDRLGLGPAGVVGLHVDEGHGAAGVDDQHGRSGQ